MPETGSIQQNKFTKRLGAFSSATLLSRILGYIRDALVAAVFGGGGVTDAFYAAFKIPNLLRRFLGEGSLTAAFVPVLNDVLHKEGKEEANRFFSALFSGLLGLLIVLVGLGMVFAPQIAQVVAWGFTRDPEKLRLTADLLRLTCPFLLFVSLAALVAAALNSSGRFFIPGIAPSGLSIAEITFISFVLLHVASPSIHGLAISAVVGGMIHFLWQLPALFREGFQLKFANPFSHPKVKTVFYLMIPTVLGLSSDQVNSFVDQFAASFLREGSITALYNSNRVMQLPLALFGIAVASVALPSLSKAISQNNMPEFKNTLNFSIRIANFVLIPSFFGLAVLGLPIIEALFEHGKFTPEHTQLTYLALVPYCFGLPAYSTMKILASSFYSLKDTKTPVRISLWAMAANVVMVYFLMWPFEVAGLATAAALSAWGQAIALFWFLRKRVGRLGGNDIFKSFAFGSLAGLFMGILCWIMAYVVLKNFSVYFRVGISIVTGVGFYVLLAKLLRIKELRFFIGK